MTRSFASRRHEILDRRALLRGVSLTALMALTPALAHAQTAATLARAAGNTMARPVLPPAAAGPGALLTPGMAGASARALANMARATQARSLAAQANAAARASAAALPTAVPNGLGAGGLNPVARGVRAAADLTGTRTWQGADQPTQTLSGGIANVSVKQTEARALLSWETFNVGRDTVLTFDQSGGGAPRSDWTVLNRVVGQLDPATGRRNPAAAPAPSQILGAIKADGNVLILNPNGVLFGGTAQVNARSLIASSLEIGRQINDANQARTLFERNVEFLGLGLLGYADQASDLNLGSAFTFSSQRVGASGNDPLLEGAIEVAAGARITSSDSGYIMLAGPRVSNSGELTSTEGQVILQAGRRIFVRRAEDDAEAGEQVRGFLVSAEGLAVDPADHVVNTATGLLSAERGSILLGATLNGAIIQDGHLFSTTSVSRNAAIRIAGGDIRFGAASTVSVTPDDGGETIPQSPASIADFNPSSLVIGSAGSRIEFASGSLFHAPSGDVTIGAAAGITAFPGAGGDSRIFIADGATIDVGGVKDVIVPASRNSIRIAPVKGNELRDTPAYRNSFLNGAEVFVDPRRTGVRADGVRWVGSPLIEAESFYQQVGVTAAELMTTGGTLVLGTAGYAAGSDPATSPDVIVRPGASIDISGGWVRYEAGAVRTTQLVTATGQVVDIGDASPDVQYVGVAGGYTLSVPRLGTSRTFANPLLEGDRFEVAFTEGRDAGSLTIKSPAIALDGTIHGQAFAGTRQIAQADSGSAIAADVEDRRALQGAPSELPAGGLLTIQAIGKDLNGTDVDGASVRVTASNEGVVAAPSSYGQSVSIDASGGLLRPARDAGSLLDPDRQSTIALSAAALSNSGFSQISTLTSGSFDLDAAAAVTLTPGGAFTALAGRAITIDGTIAAKSGTIDLETFASVAGSAFDTSDDARTIGSHDIVLNGTLDAAGRWVNDFGAGIDTLGGRDWIDGGAVRLTAAARALVADPANPTRQSIDVSGSVLVNEGALIDLAAGGRVGTDGALDLSARGGDLTLSAATTYFQIRQAGLGEEEPGSTSGFRVTANPRPVANPTTINARVALADGSVRAHGFAGGGTFSLTTPAFAFGDGTATTGTVLPLDFLPSTGFDSYEITSYATALLPNSFVNTLGGINALLATQTVTIGAGETLTLSRSMFSPFPAPATAAALQTLATGGDLYSVLAPSVPAEAFDRDGVALSLDGLIELKVAAGGAIRGDNGASLGMSKLLNEGEIRLTGGAIRQSETLPLFYTNPGAAPTVIAVRNLDEAFTARADGRYLEAAPNRLGILAPGSLTRRLTNAQLAAQRPIYLLGELDADDGIVLAPGSITDLAGASLRNPRAGRQDVGGLVPIIDGTIVDGGTLATSAYRNIDVPLFASARFGSTNFRVSDATAVRVGRAFTAAAGAAIDLGGAADSYDRPDAAGRLVATPQWSAAGTLAIGAGGTLTGAAINARGGAPDARDGTLVWRDPVLVQAEAEANAFNRIAANAITSAGFDTFVATGGLQAIGDISLTLDRAFFLESQPNDGLNFDNATADRYLPTLGATGNLAIAAPYIGFRGIVQTIGNPSIGASGEGRASFTADTIDVTGALLFDRSLTQVTFDASGDLRLIGARAPEQTLGLVTTVANSLGGQLVTSGDLDLRAARIYPTTGSTFTVASLATDGVIRIADSDGSASAAPYAAGGALRVQAARIVQQGELRVPLGTLTLGSSTPLTIGTASAPATQSVTLGAGSLTSVSASGLSIPYGTTTDGIEYFFSPTTSDRLTAPPRGVLTIGGADIALEQGSTIDTSGGGDVYAYEFIPGTGGSRDVLDRINNDPFSGNDGLQYPDGRQVYAIVPGLRDADAALVDPLYSEGYDALYTSESVGRRVYLDGAADVPAGWYTLLPARYALLPGGLRVVEQTDAGFVTPGREATGLDGSIVVSGRYGDAGTDGRESTVRSFVVQPQSVIRSYSNILLTSASDSLARLAARNGLVAPRLPRDAGQLILRPELSLALSGTLTTAPAAGGRGGAVDISGAAFEIVNRAADASGSGNPIVLTAASLNSLNASSLLIGGVRTENADGSTDLAISSRSIIVDNTARDGATGAALTAPEILFVVDGPRASIDVRDGAAITAVAGTDPGQTGAYRIDGNAAGMTGEGALLRVSSLGERLVERTNIDAVPAATLTIGDAELGSTGARSSILIDTTGALAVDRGAVLTRPTAGVDSLVIGTAAITFANAESATGEGFIVTPSLAAVLGTADRLSLQTPAPIAFGAGNYVFRDLTVDTPGLRGTDGGLVSITVAGLDLRNTASDLGRCGAGGLACGNGALAITAGAIRFGSGALATYGFGDAVSLTANSIVYSRSASLDVGPAALSIASGHIVDSGDPAEIDGASKRVAPALALRSTGAITISGDGRAAPADGAYPGSSLSITGESISLSGTRLRATAGAVSLTAREDISVGAGSIVETPGYSRVFGDDDDSYRLSAPGGVLKLTSTDGDILLASGSRLAVGGASGGTGTLQLVAARGDIVMTGAIDGASPDGGGGFSVETAGAFDLGGFVRTGASGFSRSIDIVSGTGALELAAGQTLRAARVRLVADGRGAGAGIAIAGTIDASGVNGGSVDLYGAERVSLASTARIDAHAEGYATNDPRVAQGGDVRIGITNTASRIDVAAGATIDVAARRTGDRLLSEERNGVTTYTYVEADRGGTLSLRAPIRPVAGGPDTVNIGFQGSVTGARDITLEAFRRVRLDDIVADGFAGVTIDPVNGNASIDVRPVAGRTNYFSDDAELTLTRYIRRFDVSGAYAALGGLADLPEFRARPGIELFHHADISLASNWNFGAGQVDIPAAIAAGAVVASGDAYFVVAGREADLLQNHTLMNYRTGGSISGEAPIVTIRSLDNVRIQGSVTDGFFTFRDQTDPDYLAFATGQGAQVSSAAYRPTCSGSCAAIPAYRRGVFSNLALNLTVLGGETLAAEGIAFAPLNNAVNTPWSPGAGANNAGDPIGSASLFPTLVDNKVAASTSYRIVAGSDGDSADPLKLDRAVVGSLSVEGGSSYGFGGGVSFGSALTVQVPGTSDYVPVDQFFNAVLAANPGLNPDARTNIAVRIQASATALNTQLTNFLTMRAAQFFADYPGQFEVSLRFGQPNLYTTSLRLAALFAQSIGPELAASFADPANPLRVPGRPSGAGGGAATVIPTRTLVRTGTGSIDLAASGDVDIRNGTTPTYRTITGAAATAEDGFQIGGTAVYTAGHRAVIASRAVTDIASGAALRLDPAYIDNTNFVTTVPVGPNAYNYGVTQRQYLGVLLPDPFYGAGGGDVSVTAGNDVLGRRDAWQEARISPIATNFLGTGDQAWALGSIGPISNIRMNAQLFTAGFATLGGGDVSVRAGANVVDVTVAAPAALTTADTVGEISTGRALWQVGGGDVLIEARKDIRGGRVDIGRGSAVLAAGEDIRGAGVLRLANNGVAGLAENNVRVRLSNAAAAIQSRGSITLQGVGALAARQASAGTDAATSLNARGLYSSIAAVELSANGSIDVANNGDVVTGALPATAGFSVAVLPGSFEAVSFAGDLSLAQAAGTADVISLYPDEDGRLGLFAAGNIGPMALAMEDGDPGLLPGAFSIFTTSDLGTTLTGRSFGFPTVLPDSTDADRRALHRAVATHTGDAEPARIVAGGDISGLILSVPKQARVSAGRDLTDAIFIGQNLVGGDITRITAGRDIVATTSLVRPQTDILTQGDPQAALRGNSFLIGGPGAFYLEAGRDAGPFLNSAVINGFETGASNPEHTGELIFGGGVISLGNELNPFLNGQGADVTVAFGIAAGADYAALRETYLNPANIDALDDDLFVQVSDAAGNSSADRSRPIYEPRLVAWLRANAPAELAAAVGTANPSFAEAYAVFAALPALRQRPFLLKDVYFNEIEQTSVPTGPSFEQYSRGYRAVNTLFPPERGYTANSLDGGEAGASETVETGNLDLRLATIQTSRGGDVMLLGPGGRVVAGSTVRTSEQAARRTYDGGRLFQAARTIGSKPGIVLPAQIDRIPAGFEGVLTLRGGAIRSFTDSDLLLNQSRLFTQGGGDITLFSSNGDLNAGQGPKSSANFPPVSVQIDSDGNAIVDSVSGVSGAGIAAFLPAVGSVAPDVFLIAPRGTVDAGDAGVRVAGNLFIAAQAVANAENFAVGGEISGIRVAASVDAGAAASASAGASAAQRAAQQAVSPNRTDDPLSRITVNVEGYSAGEDPCAAPNPPDYCPPR